jgi:hypothetical protein
MTPSHIGFHTTLAFTLDVDMQPPSRGEILPGSSPHMTTPEAEVLSRLTDVLSQHNSPGNGAAVVRELKLLLPELEQLEGPPCHQAQLTLANLLLTPHTFAVHAQLKQCIAVVTKGVNSGSTFRMGLTLRLDEQLFRQPSLWPDDGGALRSHNSPMPGWLQLLLDVPVAEPVVQRASPRLLRLLAISLHDAARDLVREPAAAASSSTALELSKSMMLVFRTLKASLVSCGIVARTTQEVEDGRALVTFPSCGTAASLTSEDLDHPLLVSDDGLEAFALTSDRDALAAMGAAGAAGCAADHAAGDESAGPTEIWTDRDVERLLEAVRLICKAALSLVLLRGVAADTALAASHLLCTACDVLLPPSTAAHHLLMQLDCARMISPAVLAIALRGTVQGASTATLLASLPSEAASLPVGYDCLRCTSSGSGGGARDTAGWPEGLLFGTVGSGIVSACAEACEANCKLSSFRALEALFSHMEEAGSLASRADVEHALGVFASSALQLIFDHWEMSFQSLTSMLMPLLRRLLKLLAARSSCFAEAAPQAAPGWLLWLLPRVRQMDWTRRAKYRTLQAMVGVLPAGARTLMVQWPSLLRELFGSMHIPNYATLAGELLVDVMHSLELQIDADAPADRELPESAVSIPSVKRGMWMELVITPLLTSITGVATTQCEIILQACLPALLSAQPAALSWLLDHAQRVPTPGPSESGLPSGDGDLHAMRLTMAVLKVARDLGLLTGEGLTAHASRLEQALDAADEQVAHDALHVVCSGQKQIEPVSTNELQLLRRFWPTRIKGASPHARKQLANAMRKLLQRLKRSTFGSKRDRRDLDQLRGADISQGAPSQLQPIAEKRDYARAVADWLVWLRTLLEQQLYPGVPVTRALFALELYELFVDTWAPLPPDSPATTGEPAEDPTASLVCMIGGGGFEPASLYGPCIASRLVQLLLQDFEAVRAVAFGLLARFPFGALPGFGRADEVAQLAQTALPLVLSPRVYEADAGTAVLRLLTHRYVSQLGWTLCISTSNDESTFPLRASVGVGQPDASARAIDTLVGSLLTLLDDVGAAAQRGDAARAIHVHGIVSTLRQTAADAEAAGMASAWREKLPALLAACQRICDASATVLCEGNDVVDGGGGSVPDFLGGEMRDDGVEDDDACGMPDLAPVQATQNREGRLRIVVNWMAVKEASLAVGQMVRLALPAPSKSIAAPAKRQRARGGTLADATAAAPLSRDELDAAGCALVKLLMRTRHTGVIERASLALSEVSERLLSSCSPPLASLPSEWLRDLLSGGSAVTYLRRSAGLPHAVLGILRAERIGTPSGGMFESCMASLLRDAQRGSDSRSSSPPASPSAVDSAPWLSRVHALNLIRLIFLDRAFSLPILTHVSAGFLTAFCALSASEWAVRNSGMLLFAALLQRTLRQSRTRDANASQADDANGIGIRDFFSRAPAVRPYLITSLDAVLHGSTGHVHAGVKQPPELYPMLLLLSKLVPSPTTTIEGSASPMDLRPLVPLVRECGAMPALRVRVIAADALVPLIEVSELPSFLPRLATELRDCRSANCAHGTLLQLKALTCAAVARAATLVDGRRGVTALCGTTLDALRPALALLNATCPAIRISLIQLLAVLVPRGPSSTAVEASAAIMQAANANSASFTNATWEAELLSLAVWLCHLDNDRGGPSNAIGEALLLRMLSSRAYEVRVAGLLAIRQLLGLSLSEVRDVDDAVPTLTVAHAHWCLHKPQLSSYCRMALSHALLGFVATDEQRPVVQHAMRLLCDEPTLLHCSASPQIRPAVLARMQTRDHDMRALALELLSLTPGRVPLDEVTSSAHEEMPVALRVAAVSAIDVSDAMDPRMWRLVLSLLDDDDADVREAMARRMSHELLPGRGLPHVALVRQLCWVRCKTLGLLSELFPASTDGLLELQQPAGQVAHSSVPESGQPAYSVFPKDTANFYSEPSVDAATITYLSGTCNATPLGWVL